MMKMWSVEADVRTFLSSELTRTPCLKSLDETVGSMFSFVLLVDFGEHDGEKICCRCL